MSDDEPDCQRLSREIEWKPGRYVGSRGFAGGVELFGVHYGTKRQDAMWALSTTLPISGGRLGQRYHSAAEAQAAATDVLEAFVARITSRIAVNG